MITPQERKYLDELKKQGKTDKTELRAALASFRLGVEPTFKSSEKPSDGRITTRLKETAGDIGEFAKGLGETFGSTKKAVEDVRTSFQKGEQGLGRSIYQAVGKAAGGLSEGIGQTFLGAGKVALNQEKEDAVANTAIAAIKPVVESEAVARMKGWYDGLDPVEKRDLDATLGIGSLLLDAAGAGLLKKGGTAVAKGTATRVADAATSIADNGRMLGYAVGASKTGNVVKGLAKGVRDNAEIAARGIAQTPKRIAINSAERSAKLATIKSLPSKAAKVAASEGIDINDIKFITKLPASQKASLNKLAKATRDFAAGTSKTNPIEVVGKPIVSRLKQLDAKLTQTGAKLGAASEKLGNVTSQEVFNKVLPELKKVSGLQGLKSNAKGILDFTDTSLATSLSKSEQAAIQKIFSESIKAGTGKSKHLLRQELFEILGGKKQAKMVLTGTQEKAYDAVRKGLSEVLDGKNSTYKALSKEYATQLQPLKEMRKLIKATPGVDDDILEMSAGLLARRLTSNAPSNPQIRSLLRRIDAATKIPGKTSLNIEQLQDFYNVLEKYYNISGKTSLKGIVDSSISKATSGGSISGKLLQAVDDFAGANDITKMKALEGLLDDVFGNAKKATKTSGEKLLAGSKGAADFGAKFGFDAPVAGGKLAATLNSHIGSSKQILQIMPNVNQQELYKRTIINISDQLKKEGVTDIAQKIASIDLNQIQSFDALEAVIRALAK